MKTCPSCHRTFEDNLTFCLVDGSVLSAPNDPSRTPGATVPHATAPPPTAILNPTTNPGGPRPPRLSTLVSPQPLPIYSPPKPPSQASDGQGGKPWLAIGIAVFVGLLLIAGGVMAFVWLGRDDAALGKSNSNPNKSNSNGNANVGSSTDSFARDPGVERTAAMRTLLFKDDFVGSGDAAPLFGNQFMSFQSANGIAQLTGKFAGIVPVMYRNLDLRDFVAEFDIKNPNAPKSSAGLLFRSRPGQGGGLSAYYAVGLGFVTPTATLFCFKDGSWPVVQEFLLSNVEQTSSGFHRVRLEVAGEKLRLFVDDKPAFDFTDGNLLANGGFGLFITSDVASPSTVQIANLRIYAVE